MFRYYENGDGGVMKMAKLPSPMLESVTMCNDKISNKNKWFWDILHYRIMGDVGIELRVVF